ARHIRQALELRVVPEPGKAERRIDGVLVDQVAAEDDHAEAGPGALLVIGDGLFGEDALVRAAHPCRADRREHDPVRDRRVPDAQWREQVAVVPGVGHARPLALSCRPGAGSGLRIWAKERPVMPALRPRRGLGAAGMARAIRY